jgi:MoaA/NifB/PqqE/SkfB family radical SAM enzyme
VGIYEKFRVGANFENIIGDIKYPCNEKRRLRKTKPFIELQFIVTRYNENEIEDILKLAEEMRVDRLHFKSLYLCSHFYDIDERKKLAEEYLPKRKDVKNRYEVNDGIPICKWRSATRSYWRKRSVILADARVVMCCYDIIMI